MRIDVLTLFPEMFEGVLGSSILKRAAEPIASPADPAQVREPVVSYHLTNIRDYTQNKHQKVDQPPFGGGPGMVIQCQPVWDAVQAAEAQDPRPATRILMTPQGKRLDQPLVEELAKRPRLLILAGHYEGFDERVIDALAPIEQVSIGDYVLSGGELPAMVLIDAVVRLQPGALGHAESAHYESFSPGTGGLLDYPHYTRPREWQGREVPEVLLSGDHAKIEAWRNAQARQRTAERRPDLLGLTPTEAGPLPTAVIREAGKPDADALDRLYTAAFPTDAEAKLVRLLHRRREAFVSLVAEVGGQVVAHAALSPVELADQPALRGLAGLGPVAVDPIWQGRGLGSAVVRAALREAETAGVRAVFVLGEPAYYGRFGFEPAAAHGFSSDYEAGEAFQVRVLRGPLPEHLRGRVRYSGAFREMFG